jgi:uncharacterized membrane protein YfcA
VIYAALDATSNATTIYIVVVIFFATVIRSTVGFGEALVAVPLLSLRLPVAVAAPLAVAVSLLVAGLIVAQDWRQIEVRSASWLAASSLLGIPIGLLMLTLVDDHLVKLILGIIIIAFALYSLTAKRTTYLERDHLSLVLGAGFISGVLGGAYGMNGPPLAIYGALRRWSPQRFRATLQGYFFAASLAGLIGYAVVGLLRASTAHYMLLSLPSIVLGVIGGRALNQRLRSDGFFKVVYAGLAAIGAVLVFQGVVQS